MYSKRTLWDLVYDFCDSRNRRRPESIDCGDAKMLLGIFVERLKFSPKIKFIDFMNTIAESAKWFRNFRADERDLDRIDEILISFVQFCAATYGAKYPFDSYSISENESNILFTYVPYFRDIQKFTKTSSYHIDLDWQAVEGWLKKQEREIGLDLNPEFQRDHVWSVEQQVRYVEFVLRGGKSSRDIYFNSPSYGEVDYDSPLILVDGKQRLRAVECFLKNEIPAFGHFFEKYGDNLPVWASFSVNINDLKTYKEVLQWYLDINSGGVVHTQEEIEKVRKLLEKEK